jgi:putative transposase
VVLTQPPETGPESKLVFGSMERRQKVARRHYRPEEILAKLREAEVLLGQGMKVPELVRELGIHEITYYRWRKEYGGMRINQMKRLKELETENSRLRKAVSDLTLDKIILQEAAKGNF